MSTSYNDFLKTCASLTADAFQGVHAAPVHERIETAYALLPFPKAYVWDSLLQLPTHVEPVGPLASAVPFVWQLDPLVNMVARKLHVPSVAVQQKNSRLLQPFHVAASLHTIITTPELVPEIERIFETVNDPPSLLVVIHMCESSPSFVQVESDIFPHTHNEIHLAPGLPLFVQSVRKGHMELSEEFSGTFEDTSLLVTANSSELTARINELEVPYQVSKNSDGTFKVA